MGSGSIREVWITRYGSKRCARRKRWASETSRKRRRPHQRTRTAFLDHFEGRLFGAEHQPIAHLRRGILEGDLDRLIAEPIRLARLWRGRWAQDPGCWHLTSGLQAVPQADPDQARTSPGLAFCFKKGFLASSLRCRRVTRPFWLNGFSRSVLSSRLPSRQHLAVPQDLSSPLL
jgi:hypothetical protein